MSAQQQIGAVGIDFGSNRTVIGVAKKKGVDVICNQASSRETANIVGYGEKERYMGEQGAARAKSNFKNTCSFSGRLIGLTPDYPKLKEETKWITCKFLTNENNELVYDVLSRGERKQFTPLQVTAAMLTELKKIIAHNDIANKEAVLSVPSYFTEQEKKALLDAAKLADLKVPRLLSECSATTLSYGLFRKADLPEKDKPARNVLFVDFGHSKLSTFVSSFTKEKCKVVLQEHDRHLGARDFDWTLLKKYDEIFQKENDGLSILENKKSILRALDAIQKQRKILSANTHASINAECLVEDCDLSYDMAREEFEKLIEPELIRIRAHLEEMKKQICEQKLTIHSIEIVGCASRTPAFQALITELFEQEINRTLNQSECIARGCAMMAAYLSPQFRVAEYQLEECNTYPIQIQWNFQNNGEMVEEGKTATFFDKGCTIPNIKSLTFKRTDGIHLNFFYKDIGTGFKSEIQTIKIPTFNPQEDDFHLKVRVKLNLNGVVELTECAMIETYKVEKKVKKAKKAEDAKDKKDKKEGDKEEDEFEIKISTETRTTTIDVDCTNLYSLNAKDAQDLLHIEQELTTHDRIIMETNEKKNTLETTIYDWRDKMSSKFSEYIEQSVVPKLTELLNTSSAWLDNDGYEAPKGQYVEKLDAIAAFTGPILKRFQQYEQLPTVFQQIEVVLKSAEDFVASTDEKFAHITAEDRQPMTNECQKIRATLQEAQQKLQSTPKSEEPAITVEKVNELGNALMNLSRPIMGKPAPKKEEEKKEEGEKKEEEGEKKAEEKQNTEEQPKAEKMEEE